MTLNWDSVRDEAAQYLQDLVRIDTTNPPGNETRAAEYLSSILTREGFEPLVLESVPGRGNLITRLKGDGRASPLLLMAHLDVVPAEADKWIYPPFSGHIANGYIWGRGTLDTKELVAMELAVLLLIKRENKQLCRDIIWMANADEEAGGKFGAGWIVKEHPDLVRADFAINEGGGFGLDVLERRFYACQVAEKGTARFIMRTHGRPGHGSQPSQDNAILKLSDALQKIGKADLPVHASNTVRLFIEGIAARVERQHSGLVRALLDPKKHRSAIERLPMDDGLRSMFYAMLHNTVTPTMLAAGSKINVIPSTAQAHCDARLLPGQTAHDLLREVQPIVGRDVEIEFLDDTPALECDFKTPLFGTISRVMARHKPDAVTLPYLVVGATDARHVSKLGTKVYGFSPMTGSTAELDRVHGHDERISIENMGFGTRVLYDVVTEFCTSA